MHTQSSNLCIFSNYISHENILLEKRENRIIEIFVVVTYFVDIPT